MYPKLFEIPLWSAVQASWTTFLVLVGLLSAAFWASGEAARRGRKLSARLLSTLPLTAFVTAFLTFVEGPWGKMPINSYGFSIMVGFLLACWIAVRRGRSLGMPGDFLLDVGIIGMIFGIVGAKINYLLQYSGDIMKGETLPPIWADTGLHPLGALILGPIPFAFWWWRSRKSGTPVRLLSWQSAVLLVLTLVFALVGTRALYLYLHRTEYSWKVFKSWQSGFVLYGGLLAGTAASALYVKMRGRPLGGVADLAAAPMMLAQAFGRLGCFLNGCCYGKPGEGFPCVRFPAESPAAGKSVHPTQLYETAATLGFFFFLSWLGKRKGRRSGDLFLIMILLYGGWRFFIEFLRGDERPRWIGTLTYSQVVSLLVLIAAGLGLALRRLPSPPLPEPPPPPAVPSSEPPAPPAS